MIKPYTSEEIYTQLTESQALAEIHVEGDSMEAIISHANNLSARLAMSGKLLADAKYHRSNFYGSAVMEMLKKQTSEVMYADAQKKYLMSISKDHDYLVDWAERVNATLTHQLDFMRSLISKEKELMKMASLPLPSGR